MTTKVNGNTGSTLFISADSNIEVLKLDDGRIAYVFNPAMSLGPSKSGKTTMVSTTSGSLTLPGLPVISVNVYRK